MRFTLLEAMEPMTLFFIYCIAAVVGLFFFYLIIKWAVKDGMIEAHKQMNMFAPQFEKPAIIQRPANPGQW